MNIFLIGFMGSGKTTIGRKLSAQLQFRFVDLDGLIEEEMNMSVSELFSKMGEPFFRNKEKEMILDIIKNENQVISVGGGAPCFFNNLEIMNDNGITIYLKMTSGTLLQRLLQLPAAARANRPLLVNKSREELFDYISSTLEKREEFYNKAKIVVSNEVFDTSLTVGRILTAINHLKK